MSAPIHGYEPAGADPYAPRAAQWQPDGDVLGALACVPDAAPYPQAVPSFAPHRVPGSSRHAPARADLGAPAGTGFSTDPEAVEKLLEGLRNLDAPGPSAAPAPALDLDRARGVLADAFRTAARWYQPLGEAVCSSCDGSGVCRACEGNAGKAAAFERLHGLVISAVTGRDVLLVIASLNDGGLDAVMPASDASAVLALLDPEWRTA